MYVFVLCDFSFKLKSCELYSFICYISAFTLSCLYPWVCSQSQNILLFLLGSIKTVLYTCSTSLCLACRYGKWWFLREHLLCSFCILLYLKCCYGDHSSFLAERIEICVDVRRFLRSMQCSFALSYYRVWQRAKCTFPVNVILSHWTLCTMEKIWVFHLCP